jgi:Effector Associated Constant Component 1
MDVYLSIDSMTSENLVRDLRTWLVEEGGQWGRIRVAEREPTPGTLGPIADAVQLAVGSTGAVSSLASVIVAWLQYRKPDVTMKLSTRRHQSSSMHLQARHAQTDHEAARDELAAWLAEVIQAESECKSGAEDGN